MHQSVLDYLSGILAREEVAGRFVLEVGAVDVNGSARTVVEKLEPALYVGTDMRPGPGVDVVADAKDLPGLYPEGADVVVCVSMLEHARDWKSAVRGMVDVLKPGGLLILTTVSPGYPLHEYPGDYWRFPIPAIDRKSVV